METDDEAASFVIRFEGFVINIIWHGAKNSDLIPINYDFCKPFVYDKTYSSVNQSNFGGQLSKSLPSIEIKKKATEFFF